MFIKPMEDKVLTVKFSVYEEPYSTYENSLFHIRDGEWESSVFKIFEWFDCQELEEFKYLMMEGLKEIILEHYYNDINFFNLGSYELVELDDESLNKITDYITEQINILLEKYTKEEV